MSASLAELLARASETRLSRPSLPPSREVLQEHLLRLRTEVHLLVEEIERTGEELERWR